MSNTPPLELPINDEAPSSVGDVATAIAAMPDSAEDDAHDFHDRRHHHRHPPRPDHVSPEEEKEQKRYFRVVLVVVIFLALHYVTLSGMENGITPCVLTTLRSEFNVTVTALTVSHATAEVSKVVGSIVAGYAGSRGSIQVPVVAFGIAIWAAGSILLGLAQNIFMLALGFLFAGMGYSFLVVLTPAIIDYFVPAGQKHRMAFFLGICYTCSGLGVALAFLVCGFTVEYFWRGNYFGVVGVTFPVTALLIIVAGRLRRLRRALFFDEDAKQHLLFDQRDDVTATSVDTPADTATTIKGFFRSFGSSGGSQAKSPVQKHRELHPCCCSCCDMVCGGFWHWRVFRDVRSVISTPGIRFTIIGQTAMAFSLSAFNSLMPLFIETNFNVSKSHVSFVLAACVPAVSIGLVGGGVIVDKMEWNTPKTLEFIFITVAMSIPFAFVFVIPNLWVFLPCLLLALVGLFFNLTPAITGLARLARIRVEHEAKLHKLRREAIERALLRGEDPERVCCRIPPSAWEQDFGVTDPDLKVHQVEHRIEKLVSYSNAVGNCAFRLVGSSLGNVTLAWLIDNGSQYATIAEWFTCMGVFSSSVCTFFSFLAWRSTWASVVEKDDAEMDELAMSLIHPDDKVRAKLTEEFVLNAPGALPSSVGRRSSVNGPTPPASSRKAESEYGNSPSKAGSEGPSTARTLDLASSSPSHTARRHEEGEEPVVDHHHGESTNHGSNVHHHGHNHNQGEDENATEMTSFRVSKKKEENKKQHQQQEEDIEKNVPAIVEDDAQDAAEEAAPLLQTPAPAAEHSPREGDENV